jgi:hypothetical protein
MNIAKLIPALCLAVAGCAQLDPTLETPANAALAKQTGDAYLACLSREAEKEMKNAAGAEDIATAAHGRCWSMWDTHRQAVSASYVGNARTAEEKQFANDRTEAHLRQFEREARRTVVESVVERTLKPTTPASSEVRR